MDARFAVTATRPARRSAGRRPADRPWASGQWSSGSRRGFTLVEMLTVVVIIGILASLITGAAIAAKRRAMIAVTGIEISQFDAGLKAYKERHAEYPPDFSGLNSPNVVVRDAARKAVLRHLTKAFPRYMPGTPSSSKEADPWERLRDDIDLSGLPAAFIDQLDPASALVFWLGGLPDTRNPDSPRLIGFSANSKNPFDATSSSRLPPLFEFDLGRLKRMEDGVWRYFPDIGGSGETAPYVYFRASSGGYSGHPIPAFDAALAGHPEWGATGPCRDTRVPLDSTGANFDWANRDSFQIRAAGLDGIFGTGVLFPSGEDYDEATYDDQTNFGGGTLEDKM